MSIMFSQGHATPAVTLNGLAPWKASLGQSPPLQYQPASMSSACQSNIVMGNPACYTSPLQTLSQVQSPAGSFCIGTPLTRCSGSSIASVSSMTSTSSTISQPAAVIRPSSVPITSHSTAAVLGTCGSMPKDRTPAVSDKDRAIIEAASQIYEQIDLDGQGSISKLDLIEAVQRNSTVDEFVLPDIDSKNIMCDDACFDAVDTLFTTISSGKRRIRKHTFVRYFRKAAVGEVLDGAEIHELFDSIVAGQQDSFSRLELLEALRRNSVLAEMLLPGEDCSDIMNNAQCFDTFNDVFDEIVQGKARATFQDFDTYIRIHHASIHHAQRSSKRVLIIGVGFGDFNPQLRESATNAGYILHCVSDLPDPDRSTSMPNCLAHIKAAIDEFQPQLVACASKGGQYVVGLWQMGLWRGPTLMINAHPNMTELPKNVPIVIAHGGNDTHYRRTRESLEELISTGTANMCFLYYAANSGKSASGQCSRTGDTHAMESLLCYDSLPRLMDAAMSQQSPETHMLWSCQHRLSRDRIDAEKLLGYCPNRLRQYWESAGQKGRDHRKLYEVTPGSQEFNAVAAIFSAAPKEAPAYSGAPGVWQRTQVVKVERVENGSLESGTVEPYYDSLRRSIEEQGIPFEEGVHTRWGFHGTDAIDSIIMDPLTGFQPLTSGSRLGTLWGPGTYFARDARYVVESSFCSSKKMLLCLMMTGIPCLGDPEQRGVLPLRQNPHRYNSAVDSLSNPEVFVLHNPGAAYPAYVISFS